jgi:hypothetical protein
MKRRVLTVLCALALLSTPLFGSQGGPKPKSVKPPKPTQTSVSKSVKPTSPKVKPVSAKTTVSKPPKPVKATTVKPTKSTTKTAKATKPVKSTTTKSAKAEVKGNKKTTTTASTTTGTTSGTTTETSTTTNPTTDTSVPLTKVQEKLKRNTNLAAKLEGRLPEGTDLMKAAYGFKNLGQFVAAVNVSYNHEGISFTELKTLMVKEGYSLGQAMQKLKATDATTTAQRAEYDANRMIETSEREIASPTGVTATSVPTTTTSSTTSSTTTTTASKAKPKKSKKTAGAQQ